MRPLALAALAGAGLGLLAASCSRFDDALADYCSASKKCVCDGGDCCVTEGSVAGGAARCCPGLTPKPLDGGALCCAQGGCLGLGGLGSGCASFSQCSPPLACAAQGAGATCQGQVCWVEADGGAGGCGSGPDDAGAVTLSGGGDPHCGLPGYRGPFPCCYDRCVDGGVCGCQATGSCACSGGSCAAVDPGRACPP